MTEDTSAVTITPELSRGILRSYGWIVALQRRNVMIWALGLIALWSSVFLGSSDSLLIYIGVAWIGWLPLHVFMARTNLRKTLATTMPIGSTYSLRVGRDGLTSESAAGSGHVKWNLFSELRIRGDVAALRYAGRTVYAITPRAAWSASDVELAREFLAVRS